MQDNITRLQNRKNVQSYKLNLIDKLLEHTKQVVSVGLATGQGELTGLAEKLSMYSEKATEARSSIAKLDRDSEGQ
ncbi:MAG: hypothetical protein U5N86_06925 [Planctomycetota bacterium]|nr:hypothetical protein [Planctomycetota bacterium]